MDNHDTSHAATRATQQHVLIKGDWMMQQHVFNKGDCMMQQHVFNKGDWMMQQHVFNKGDWMMQQHVFNRGDWMMQQHVFESDRKSEGLEEGGGGVRPGGTGGGDKRLSIRAIAPAT